MEFRKHLHHVILERLCELSSGMFGFIMGYDVSKPYISNLCLKWKCLNLPGTRPFSLTTVAGEQPVNLTLYAQRNKSSTLHLRRDIVTLSHIEISNTSTTSGGLYEKSQSRRQSIQESKLSTSYDDELDEDDEQDEDLVIIDIEESSDDEGDEVSELGDGMYVRGGDQITLSVVPNFRSANEGYVGAHWIRKDFF